MDIGIIGYGKMGQEIEKIAIEKGHEIIFKINSKNKKTLNKKTLSTIDVAIEFSNPNDAFENIKMCINNKIPIVCGTTGWLHKFHEAEKMCLKNNSSFLYAPNFSIGMNLFFEINNYIAKLMKTKNYEILIEEKHHKMKKDIPSGTAIKIKNDICKHNTENLRIPIVSKRIGKLKGEHIIKYISPIDEVKISHKAYSRAGFAKGAILAAEFIKNKKGVFSMNDVINNL